ncbi:MAG: NAD-dependent epimerase/dehydratase family protein [Methylotenera sp.]|nr:NAD-dependent epimerase/dehydratase family protein [Methylotenera sp.]
MKGLITGATGFVGRLLCAELLNQGHEVWAAVRTKVVPIKNVEMTIVGEIDSGTDWSIGINTT